MYLQFIHAPQEKGHLQLVYIKYSHAVVGTNSV